RNAVSQPPNRLTAHHVLPHLRFQRLAKALVTLAADDLETRRLVDLSRRFELALGPQLDALVSSLTRDAHHLVDETAAQSEAARGGFHEQQAELRNRLRLRDDEHG